LTPAQRQLLLLNPMAACVETFKWGVLGVGTFDPVALAAAALLTAAVVVCGLVFFSRIEMARADEQ
jgi:lipopolysaccharide transport system permease protein